MDEAKPMVTPMHPSSSVEKENQGTPVSIGSLLYHTTSRPEIVFSVSLCARFQTTPKESHLTVVKGIFGYLVGTPNFDLVRYCDVDYDGDKIERKSTSGLGQMLGESLISWRCRKQNTIALSTTKAEYVAAASCCSQILWIRNQLEDFSLKYSGIPIFFNNTSAIILSKNPIQHSKYKHIDIKHHFIVFIYSFYLYFLIPYYFYVSCTNVY